MSVLVNGRPYSSTSGDLESLPLSAIERLDLLSGDSLGTLDGDAVRGSLNVVLRKDLDGFETRSLARMPSQNWTSRSVGALDDYDDGGSGVNARVAWV